MNNHREGHILSAEGAANKDPERGFSGQGRPVKAMGAKLGPRWRKGRAAGSGATCRGPTMVLMCYWGSCRRVR